MMPNSECSPTFLPAQRTQPAFAAQHGWGSSAPVAGSSGQPPSCAYGRTEPQRQLWTLLQHPLDSAPLVPSTCPDTARQPHVLHPCTMHVPVTNIACSRLGLPHLALGPGQSHDSYVGYLTHSRRLWQPGTNPAAYIYGQAVSLGFRCLRREVTGFLFWVGGNRFFQIFTLADGRTGLS